jgi:glucose-1-phosphate thymidylyltransferase
MKGIILAGGKGTRLFPLTLAMSKQLLPLYSKPMIYYPISTLMLAGINDILLITTPEDQASFMRLLGDGSQWGIRLSYAAQKTPRGLADAFIVGREFVGAGSVALALGDNLIFGHGLKGDLRVACQSTAGAVIFAYEVKDPQRYGIVELTATGIPVSIEEKPTQPRSRLAVPGLYFYDNSVLDVAAKVKPSSRGEIEITDVNRFYLKHHSLQVIRFGRGMAWLDAGTYESLNQASNFVAAIEEREGLMIGCPEEIAFRNGWIDRSALIDQAEKYKGNSYGEYLEQLLERS